MDKEIKIEKIFSLTPVQRGILSSTRLYGDGMYLVQKRITLKGQLNQSAIDLTLEKLVQKYEVLRTFFVLSTIKEPKQVVLRERSFKANYVDLTSYNDPEKENYIADYFAKQKIKGFDLSKDLLVRLSIVKMKENVYEMLWTIHHIIMDGWSTGILLNDFIKIYTDIKNGKELQINQVNRFSSYVEYIAQNRKNDVSYWQDYLSEYENSAWIEGSKPFVKDFSYTCETKSFLVEDGLFEAMNSYIGEHKITMNVLMETVWGVLLQKYNYTNDVVFGYVASGRNVELAGIHEKVGLFINTLPIRIKSQEQEKFIDLAERIYHHYSVHQGHEMASLLDIQEHTALKSNLIKTLLVFENYPFDEGLNEVSAVEKRGFEIINVSGEEQTNYDINIIAIPGEHFEIKIMYNINNYKNKDILQIFERMQHILKQVIQNRNIKVNEISICCEEEKKQILTWSKNTNVAYPKEVCIQDVFQRQVEKTPNHIAVKDQSGELTYRELNEKSNQLAHGLRKMGVERESFVGICVEKSKELIIGILAILKAGGTYIPMDPSYPKQRILYILSASKAKLVLVDNTTKELDEDAIVINIMEDQWYENEDNKISPASVNKPKDGAYVIFTSGTTGNPKGVLIEHNNVIRLLFNDSHLFDFTNTDVWTMFHSACFDFSVWEMYGALLYGGKLVMVTKEQAREIQEFVKLLDAEKVTVLNQVPSSLYNLISYENREFPNIRYLCTGGEALSPNKIEAFKKVNPQMKTINMYGITETTVHTTYKEITLEDAKKQTSNIGKPLPTLDVYIMNADVLCGVGITGEICVAGEGLARGYVNQESLTMEKFVFSKSIEMRIYKSGDLGRWLENGEIEYLGRKDEQVKVRGFRIELKEIEEVLLMQKGVKQAVVLVKKTKAGDVAICAFLSGDSLDLERVKGGIRHRLPEYMIPSNMVIVEQLPLTANGKIDKQKLLSLTDNEITIVNPRDEWEEKLCKLYGEILCIDQVSVESSFFELGGHSLNATMLEVKIAEKFGIQIPLVDIFRYPTVRELADYMKEKLHHRSNAKVVIPNYDEQECYSLSSNQEGIYSIVKMGEDNGTMNIVLPLIFEHVDLAILKDTLKALMERHWALRTRIQVVEGVPMQRVLPYQDDMLHFETFDFSTENDLERKLEVLLEEENKKLFDIEKEALVRFKLIKLVENKYLLVFALHHIISDAWSFDILAKDMAILYQAKLEKKALSLPPITVQYVDYAMWQKENINSQNKEKQKAYWQSILKQPLPVLKLKTDFNRPSQKSVEGKNIDYFFDKELIDKLKKFANYNNGTVFMGVLTSVFAVLRGYTGQEDIIIGTPVAGREEEQLQHLVGYFLNILPLRVQITGKESFAEAYEKVKSTALGAFEHQAYPFSNMLKDGKIMTPPSHSPIFDILVQEIQTSSSKTTSIGKMKMEVYQRASIQSKYDLVFNFEESKDGLNLRLEYCTTLFKEETIQRLLDRIIKTIRIMVDEPSAILNQAILETSDKESFIKPIKSRRSL